MHIQSAVFMRGVKGDNEMLHDGVPQIAFIGRSNVGKSSLLNSLTKKPGLARTSSTLGRTQELNIFLINDTHYFVDLPGYGYARTKDRTLGKMSKLLSWYLFESPHNAKVVLLIDAEIGPTASDLEILRALENADKEIVVVLNKVDKIKKSHYAHQIKTLSEQFAGHTLVPFSSKSKIGIEELSDELLKEPGSGN